jgi:hypothetical protein
MDKAVITTSAATLTQVHRFDREKNPCSRITVLQLE